MSKSWLTKLPSFRFLSFYGFNFINSVPFKASQEIGQLLPLTRMTPAVSTAFAPRSDLKELKLMAREIS